MNASKCAAVLFAALFHFFGLCLPGEMNTAFEKKSLQFFRDLSETRKYTLGRPVSAVPTPDGRSVIFLRGGARDPVMRLYELEGSTGKVSEVLSPDQLLRGTEEKLTPEEQSRRERMRMSLRGFTTFQLSENGAEILVMLESKLYVIRRADKSVIELPSQGWIDPQFSPDSRFVAAVKNGEIFVIDVASKKQKQLTHGATSTLTHGLAEFVAQEEMDRFSGFWWCPDSKRIVYQETDVSRVEKHYIANPLTPAEPPAMNYYPRAGTANAKVRLGIVASTGGTTTWIRWDSEKFPYLARVGWMESAPLTILVQTRNQREEKLLRVDPATGETQGLLTETDSAWLNLNAGPHWLKNRSGFLWSTERNGDWQLELRAPDGKLLRPLTPVGLNYGSTLDVDEESGKIMITAAPDPREKHIFRLSLKGSKPEQITTKSGFHSAKYSKNHAAYVYNYSLNDGSWGMELRQRDGKVLAELPSVAEKIPFVPVVEFLRIGSRKFDAAIIRPRDFQPGKKYPVILSVYAGPTSKMVYKQSALFLEEQWMADQGFIVASLDGRGTPGYGREWLRAVKGNLIDIALEDQIAGLKGLGDKYPEMDLMRVGVSGWSFGGYFAAMATLRHPEVFRCGVAGAPVVDWEDYDTHYTERYLDLPSVNPEGYKKSNVLTYASRLERPLLIIHGLTDDNVYFQHSLKLINQLFASGRSYDFIPLLSTHMVPDPVMQLNREIRIMNFFREHLKPQ